MPKFSLAWRTRAAAGAARDIVDAVWAADLPAPPEAAGGIPVDQPVWVSLARTAAPPADFARRHRAAAQGAASPQAVLAALGPEAVLCLRADPAQATQVCATAPEPGGHWPLHYFRCADGTVRPRGEEPAALTFEPGDAYVAVSPGLLRLSRRPADAPPAVARFIHLRDYFNAPKLAAALLAHLLEAADGAPIQTDVTVLVLEAR